MENKIKKYLKDAGIVDFVVNHEDHNSDWKMLRRSMLVPILNNTLLAIFMIIQLMVKEDERGSDE